MGVPLTQIFDGILFLGFHLTQWIMQLVHKLQMMHHYRLHLRFAFGLLTTLLYPVES